MRSQEALVFFLIVISILSGGQGDDSSDDFLNTKQVEVQTIAQAAEGNYANTCELVATCQTAQNCSRLECNPIEHQINQLTCVYVNNNVNCLNKTGSECNTVEANYERGYVRTPPLEYTFYYGSIDADREQYLGSTICAQRNLDNTFISVNGSLRSDSSLDYFFNFYFGAADGSFRFYPGRELLTNSCGTYDPRIRPWYLGAISVLKDVVVLIDTGPSMQQVGFFDQSITYLDLSQTLVEKFVQTLTTGDRVTVLPVNASGTVLGQTDSQYSVPTKGESMDPNFNQLLDYIGNISAFAGSGTNGGATSFAGGFVGAATTFDSSTSGSMKVVILLTNSQGQNAPNLTDLASADNLTSSGVKLFVYDLQNTSVSASWGAHACDDGENFQLLAVNPLLYLSSYFSFMARARMEVSSSLIFWQKPYIDASDLGQIITVAYPAMSSDGQLIGVAGIDVQLAGLASNNALLSAVVSTLSNGNYGQIATNPNAGNLSTCKTKYADSNTCDSTTSQALCQAQPATDDELLELLCCPDCMKGGKKQSSALWIALGILGALLVVLVLLVACLVSWRIGNKRKRSQSMRSFALRDYPYEILLKATDHFSESNIVGKGAFGVVYKACIAGEEVAVKQLNQPADRADDFAAEIKILGIASHSNLVQLKGTCFQPTECFLVYEFVGRGDLYDWLWPAPPSQETSASDSEVRPVRFLTWNQRRQIARGVARGLNYLHRGLPNGRVFHLDIKPRNILLEYNYNPKIADFGISQLYEPGYTFKMASVGRGTFGYIAPEVLNGQDNPNSKLDVFSYGMVLVHLVSGRKIDDRDAKPFLRMWAKNNVEDGKVEKVVDEKLFSTVRQSSRQALMDNCKTLMNLAVRCLEEMPDLRPEMSDVLDTIDNLKEVVELQTTLVSDSETDKVGSKYIHRAIDESSPKSGRVVTFIGSKESSGPFRQLKSEPEFSYEEITGKNYETSKSFTAPTKGAGSGSHDDNDSSSRKRASTDPIRSSVDSSLEMGNVRKEPKLKTSMKRSSSLS